MRFFYGVIVFSLLTACKQEQPVTSMDYYNLGVKQQQKKKTRPLAPNSFLKAIALDSTNAKAYVQYGGYKMNSRDTNELNVARDCFQKAIELDSTNAQAWFYLGYTELVWTRNQKYYNTERTAAAKADFDKAIALDSTYAIAYANRAECYNYLGDTASRNADWRSSCKFGNSVACMMLDWERARKK
jgi:tetratricopeptide (TPR) repeat protein